MESIELHSAGNDPRLPKWAQGIAPDPPENVDDNALICACADRLLSIYTLTGEPEINERIHDAVTDLASLDTHIMDQTTMLFWLRVIGWSLINQEFTLDDDLRQTLVDKYHESCLRMSMTPLRRIPGLIIDACRFEARHAE
jgi:hypothetical protein